MRWFLILIVVINYGCSYQENLFDKISSQSSLINKHLKQKDRYEIQIVYTQIDRDENNYPSLTTYSFNYDSTKYFYPASTVKMPVSFLALQRLNELDIDKWSTIKIDSAQGPQSSAHIDTTTINGLPSVGHYIEKIFAVSDNDAYNRLYEFLGQDYINQQLRSKDIFSNSRIVTRVGISGFSTEDNRHANPINFYDKNENLIFHEDAKLASGNYFESLTSTQKGKGFYDDQLKEVVSKPFDMGKKNFINLKELEASLKRIVFPELYPDDHRFQLSQDDYNFLYWAMRSLPREHPYLQNQIDEYDDNYVKFFIYGDNNEGIPDNIKILNKVGFAYGYLTDCSYIIDTDAGIEFLLTATIHVNENEIYNDGKYEYDDGIKFLAELGREIYKLEKSRVKKNKPNLSMYKQEYKINY